MTKQQSQGRTYKVRTPYNRTPDPGVSFKGTLSKTIQSEALSLEQMMEKHTKGLPIPGASQPPIYEDEQNPSNGINPKTLDLADWELLAIQQREHVAKLKEKAKQEHLENKEKKRKQAEEQRLADDNRMLDLLKKHNSGTGTNIPLG